MKNISLYLYTIFKGTFVGKDDQDNRYYKSNITHGVKKEKRWVLYKQDNDPTTINPSWHAWLHHVIDVVPKEKLKKKFNWQKKLSPNYTGTEKAYYPPGHLLKKRNKKKVNKNYEPWDPNKKNF